MSIRNFMKVAGTSAVLFVCAGIAAAQGPVVDNNTTTSELSMTAMVQTAVRLEISTGNGGAEVTGENGEFSISFGEINGLGLGEPAAGIDVVVNGSGALYKTPINLTPIYSGFTTETATIEVEQDAAGDTAMAREGDASITFNSTVPTAQPSPVVSGAASGVAIPRWVGMYAARTEAAGSKTATLIYTITVE